MKTPIAFTVSYQSPAGFISLIASDKKFWCALRIIVPIDEVTASVVRGVNVNQLYFSEIALLNKLQRVKVITFDEQVPCSVKIDTFLTRRAKRFGDRGVCGEQRLALARPIEPVTLLRAFNDVIGQCLAKLVEIDGEADSAVIVSGFSHAIGEQCTNFCDIVLAKIRAMHLQLIHAQSIHTSI